MQTNYLVNVRFADGQTNYLVNVRFADGQTNYLVTRNGFRRGVAGPARVGWPKQRARVLAARHGAERCCPSERRA